MTDPEKPTTNDQRPTTAPIRFGTDGWRAVIADDFTFENVRRVAGAIASYVLKHEDAARGLIIGYDTRFGSPRFARAAAEVLASAGIPVKLSGDYAPTPAVSLAVKNLGAAGGVVITSSHNPWNWNGVKFKAKFGGSAPPAIMKVIGEEAAAGAMPNGKLGAIEEVDLKPAYVKAICGFADLDLIRKARFKFAVDSMYGSGRGVLTNIFREHGIEFPLIEADAASRGAIQLRKRLASDHDELQSRLLQTVQCNLEIEIVLQRALDEAALCETVDQLDCTVMGDLQPFRQRADGRSHAIGQSFERE